MKAKRCLKCGTAYTGRCPNGSAGWHTTPEERPLANLPERPERTVDYMGAAR